MTPSAPFPATQAIVDFGQSFRLASVSAATIGKVKQLVLDLLGVSVAAARHDPARTQAMATLSGATVCRGATVLGSGHALAPGEAALVNGYLAHRLEFDDTTLNPVGHPSATILPAVLALGEATGATGWRVLDAYIVGLEVHSRLGQAQVGNWSARDPWLPIGHIGLLGAAAAAARLLELDPAQSANCIGLAAHFASQLNVSNGSLAKPVGAGGSARSAITAAQLARVGLTGPAQAIERPGGFADTFLAYGRGVDLETPLRRLGAPLHVEEIGIAIKRYPSCYGTHWGIDALRLLLEEQALRAEDVESVELRFPEAAAFLDDPCPRDEDAARFSHQYGLAACLADGYPRPSSYHPDRVGDATMRSLLRRVRARPHSSATKPPRAWRYEVTVRTVAGRELVRAVKHPRGHPKDPLAGAEVEQKFAELCATLGPTACARVIERVMGLDELHDLGEVLEPFRSLFAGHIPTYGEEAVAT